jgi:hypothetical protein
MSPNLPSFVSCTLAKEQLKLSEASFYRIFPSGEQFARGMLSCKSLVDALNARRRGPLDPLTAPMPLLSEKDVAPLLLVDGKPASPSKVRRFCARRLFPIPHFDFGPKIKRFPAGAVEWWLSMVNSSVPVVRRRFRYGKATV